MQVKPWFSHEVGKDFRKRENGGEEYYQCMGKVVKILVHANHISGQSEFLLPKNLSVLKTHSIIEYTIPYRTLHSYSTHHILRQLLWSLLRLGDAQTPANQSA